MDPIKNLFISDLIQARILKKSTDLTLFKFFILILRYRTVRIHLAVRLRCSKIAFLRILSKIYLDHFHIEIGRNAKIGKYFWMPHPRCIIVADDSVIGEHVHLSQYCTIGGNFDKIRKCADGKIQKLPILGNRININPGAVIGGPVKIGNDIIIGANSIVTHDVPDSRIVFGQNQFAKKKIYIPPEGGMYKIIEPDKAE